MAYCIDKRFVKQQPVSELPGCSWHALSHFSAELHRASTAPLMNQPVSDKALAVLWELLEACVCHHQEPPAATENENIDGEVLYLGSLCLVSVMDIK